MIVALMPRFHVRRATRNAKSFTVEMDFGDGPVPHLRTQRYQSLTLAYAMAAAQAQMVLDFIRENQSRETAMRQRILYVTGSKSKGYEVRDVLYPEPLVVGILDLQNAEILRQVLETTLAEFRRYNAI